MTMMGERVSTLGKFERSVTAAREYLIAITSAALVTALGLAIEPVIGHVPVAPLYFLLVVVLGMKLRRGPVLLVAVSSGLVWDFFFIPTRYSLHIADIEDLMMLAMFFIVAMAMGHLTSRLRSSEIAERQRQRRTAALHELVHQEALAPDLDAGLRAAINLTETLFGVRASLLLGLPAHSLAA